MAKRSLFLLPVMLSGLAQIGSCKMAESEPTQPQNINQTATAKSPTVKASNENQRLCEAIEATGHDAIKRLLNEGGDPNQKCEITYSVENNYSVLGQSWHTLEYPIYVALSKKNSAALDLLLERGADVNVLNKSFPPALDYAIQNSDLQSVRVLLKYGAKPDSQGSSLVRASRADYGDDSANQRLAMVEFLLEHNAKINLGNPLLQAIEYPKDPKLIAFLIRKGADVNATVIPGGTGGHTPLHALMSYDHSEILFVGDASVLETTKLLIAKGANINATDSRQQTPLHLLAERRRSMPLAKLAITLIANGANPELKDYQKQNFFDIVQARIDQEIASAQSDAIYQRKPFPLPSGSPPPTTEQRASELAEIKTFWEKHRANR
jgi:ankyrin repeat protein